MDVIDLCESVAVLPWEGPGLESHFWLACVVFAVVFSVFQIKRTQLKSNLKISKLQNFIGL